MPAALTRVACMLTLCHMHARLWYCLLEDNVDVSIYVQAKGSSACLATILHAATCLAATQTCLEESSASDWSTPN